MHHYNNLKFILIFKIFCIKFFTFPSLIDVDNMNSLILRLNFLIIDNFSFDLKCHLEVLNGEQKKNISFQHNEEKVNYTGIFLLL